MGGRVFALRTGCVAKTTIRLSEDKARQMLALVSDQLIENAVELGAILKANVVPAIAAPAEPEA